MELLAGDWAAEICHGSKKIMAASNRAMLRSLVSRNLSSARLPSILTGWMQWIATGKQRSFLAKNYGTLAALYLRRPLVWESDLRTVLAALRSTGIVRIDLPGESL